MRPHDLCHCSGEAGALAGDDLDLQGRGLVCYSGVAPASPFLSLGLSFPVCMMYDERVEQ